MVLNLSGHNIYLKNKYSQKTKKNSGKLNPRENRKLDVDKIKYLKRINFNGN